jgi:phosphoglycolate phosphatase
VNKGDLIAHVLDAERLLPETTLMVGDRKHDIMGAKQNDVKTAAVTYGYGRREEIAGCTPDLIFDSMPALTRYLDADIST